MLIVPVYRRIVMPYSDVYFPTEEFKKNVGKSIAEGEKVVILFKGENQTREEWTDDSFYPIAISGIIKEISEYGFLSVKTMNRVNLDIVGINPDRSVSLTLSRHMDIQDMDEMLAYQKLQALKDKVMEVFSGFNVGDWYTDFIQHVDSIGTIASSLSPFIQNLSNDEVYELVEEDSVAVRTEKMEKLLYEYLEVAKVTNDANASQQKEYQDMYRESAIKKQMEYLQKELDQMHPENVTDIQRFEQKIKEAGMNETAENEAMKILNRLKQEGHQSPETGMLYDYLDFITGLSWKKEESNTIPLARAREVLDEAHYGLKKVKQRIIQQIAVMNLKKEQQGSILLFVGAPGTGKTSIGRSIAKALEREYVRVSLGGVRDEADIRGHRRTYIGAMPGRIMDGIQKSGVSNPVMVLDEVDKLSMSYNGDPASALLEVLDPEQNNTFTDHYMNVPYDLSDVMFICTANTVDTIPEPLLNRMEVIHFTGYTPIEKMNIATKHLLPKSMEAMGIPEGKLKVAEETLEAIISDYTREAGVRGLRKRMDTLCRSAAVKIAENTNAVYTVTPDMLREELDMRPNTHDRILTDQKPGVVTGLAWTQVGGEILYIETLFTKGNGKITITGQLGDVMKESAQIAVSIVKHMFPDKADLFSDNDLHIHVPEGAVPKDGPSAGITLTTALASLINSCPVDPGIAMIGEVS
ncbi:MAG: endopeptidase La, partial [Eubacterium sp.]|nr:endopeptidase La [Eubacterium sp.]